MEGMKVTQTGLAGNVLGKYRLIAELGHGGMAEVFLAVARGPAGFNKLLVIKKIRPQLAEDPEFLSMFLDEARLAARLNHSNIVQTIEVGQEGRQYFIAMEYLEGQPLNRVLHRTGRENGLPLGMHLRILSETCAGLHHAHELCDYDGTPLDVVHRDATPHNVFLTYDGQVKVVDFGIAKAMNSTSETRTGVLKGKVAYMAPEQAQGERVDRRADVFSVGVMIWEALVGRRLWKGLNDVAILNHIIAGEVPAPSTLNANVHPRLEQVCLRALARDREVRYATAAELQADLDAAIDELSLKGSVKEAGRFIAQAFTEERGKMKVIIEQQLRSAKSLGTAEYEAISLPQMDVNAISGSRPSMGSQPNAGSGSHPSHPTHSGPQSGQYPSALSSGAFNPSSVVPGTDPSFRSSLTASMAPAQSRGAGRAALVSAIAASGAVALAAILYVATNRPEAPPAAPVVAQTSTPEPKPTQPAAAKEVELKISASPPEAKLYLDGKPLQGNPSTTRLPQDGTGHELRVEAEGFVTRTRTITLEKDLALELALEKEPKKSGGGGGPARVNTGGGNGSITGDPKAKKGQRVIEDKNPDGP